MPTTIVKIDGKTKYLTLTLGTDKELWSLAKAKKTTSEKILGEVCRKAEAHGRPLDEKLVQQHLFALKFT